MPRPYGRPISGPYSYSPEQIAKWRSGITIDKGEDDVPHPLPQDREYTATVQETITVTKTVTFRAGPGADLEQEARTAALAKLAVNEAESGWEITGSEGLAVLSLEDARGRDVNEDEDED